MNLITNIVWAIILGLLIICTAIMIHFENRYFSKRAVICYFLVDGKNKKIKFYKKIGSEVHIKTLKIPQKYEDYEPVYIKCKSDMQADLDHFSLPNEDVEIYFEKVEKTNSLLNNNTYTLKVPDSVKKIIEQQVKEVLLISIEDIQKYIQTSNSNPSSYPIYNSYLVRNQDKDESNLILKIGDVIYGIVYYNDVTLKMYLRLNNFYVNSKLDEYHSLTLNFDNIYSIVINTDFKKVEDVFNLIEQSYLYSLLTYYKKDDENYFLNINNEELEKNNSLILSIDYRLAKQLDPLFDVAYQDSIKYLDKLNKIEQLNKEYNKQAYSYKKEVIDNLDKIDQGHTQDKFNPYYEYTYVKELGTTLEELNDEIDDIKQIVPSNLKLENILDYLNSKNDMFSLKVDKNEKLYSSPVILNYIDKPFLLINYSNQNKYLRFNCVINKEYINTLSNKHSFIYKTAKNKYENWYTIILDSSFNSYDEIYKIILDIYNFNRIQNQEEI